MGWSVTWRVVVLALPWGAGCVAGCSVDPGDSAAFAGTSGAGSGDGGTSLPKAGGDSATAAGRDGAGSAAPSHGGAGGGRDDGDVTVIARPADAGPEPPAAPDAGDPQPPVAPCAGVSERDLEVPGAGSGELSGCAPRTCQGRSGVPQEVAHAETSDLTVFEGCTTVEGDIIVSHHPNADLRQLSCLEHVTGSLVIWTSPALTSLDGLQALQKVDGDLSLGHYESFLDDNARLARLDALSNLRVVGGVLYLYLFAVSSLEGLHAVTAVGHLQIEGGHQDHYRTVDEVLYYGVSIEDLSGLRNLRVIDGYLVIRGGVTSTSGLSSLERVGAFDLSQPDGMQEITGFPALRCIARDFNFGGSSGRDAVSRIDAFPVLAHVGGSTFVAQFHELVELHVWDTVTTLGGDLQIINSPKLSTASLPRVQLATDAQFRATGNPQLPQCPLEAFVDDQRAGGWSGTALLDGNLECPPGESCAAGACR